jgi:hypothetical protein
LAHQGKTYRIADGGFTDNSGIGTAVEVLGMVRAAAKELNLSRRVRPIVLVISNSPPPGTEASPTALSSGALRMLADPLLVLDAVRSRIAGDYRRWLDGAIRDPDTPAVVIDWRLPYDMKTSYPLGWLLGQETKNSIGKAVKGIMTAGSTKQLEEATGWEVNACRGILPGDKKDRCEEDVRSGAR